jgi:succinate dehydrogenase / fumarate reductase flavoprotein subunit
MLRQSVERKNNKLSEEDRDYYLERYPSFGISFPRDVASRAAKKRSDAGFGLIKQESSLDFAAQYSVTERTGIHKS